VPTTGARSRASIARRVRDAPPLAAPALTAGAAAAALLLVHAVDPNEPGHYPTCPFLALTGRYCPGCGSLRALHALTNGDLAAAVGFNVVTVAVLPVLAFWWARWTWRRAHGVERRTLARPAVLVAVTIVLTAFWVVRNLSFGQALAP
jgi:hypothetical protein